MNARELLLDAALVKIVELRGDITDETLRKSVLNLAEHVLATVRDDDDEPVSEEWFHQCGFGHWSYFGSKIQIHLKPWLNIEFWKFDQTWNLVHDVESIEEIKTRGQFRALCKGLGIELKERDHETE